MMGMDSGPKVVFSLKAQPPFNFNVTLKAHALEHGLAVTNMGVHFSPMGKHISLNLSGPLENAKRFANSAVAKFGVYIHNAEVSVGNQGMFKR
jgi:hypothetical protein